MKSLKSILSVLIVLIFLLGCSRKNENAFSIELPSLKGEKQLLSSLSSGDYLVIFFLSPECPLCINYSKNMKDLNLEFNDSQFDFVAVFPGKEFSAEEMSRFMIRYELGFPALMDPEFKLTEALNATTTPEVVIIENDGRKLYQGAIDNWAIDLAKKRSRVTEFYLQDAFLAIKNGSGIDPEYVKPVGCFIQ